jgi:hypothetical protein
VVRDEDGDGLPDIKIDGGKKFKPGNVEWIEIKAPMNRMSLTNESKKGGNDDRQAGSLPAMTTEDDCLSSGPSDFGSSAS